MQMKNVLLLRVQHRDTIMAPALMESSVQIQTDPHNNPPEHAWSVVSGDYFI